MMNTWRMGGNVPVRRSSACTVAAAATERSAAASAQENGRAGRARFFTMSIREQAFAAQSPAGRTVAPIGGARTALVTEAPPSRQPLVTGTAPNGAVPILRRHPALVAEIRQSRLALLPDR